ncbi:Beta-lactamase-like protein 2 [Trichinella pseudospiralis]|uniref:Beta-lactamase-like protein 2 homolog n=1 Tax=Trichinella pseudospiralis TaxID=6337 RepID=A0A0V1FUV6_TRIPS|nr:Beta-lactamase-like protein 2 [Trichinella pseudospiralis]
MVSLPSLPVSVALSPRVYRILGCNSGSMTLQGTNTYLVGTGRKRVLIDTGEANNFAYLQYLSQTLSETGACICGVLCTHWHADHIGGVSNVARQYSVTNLMKFRRANPEENIKYEELGFEFVQEGQLITVEGATLKVIHTPGHADDHMSLQLLEENAIFSGDCILGDGSTTVFEDLDSYMKSLKKLQSLAPDLIYPGHGSPIHDAAKRIQQYIDHRQRRENQIFNVLSQSKLPLTPMDIVQKIYNETPAMLHRAASVNVLQHLEKLQKLGKTSQLNGRSVIINGKDSTVEHLWNCVRALYLVVISGCLSVANGDQAKFDRLLFIEITLDRQLIFSIYYLQLMTSGEFFSHCIASAADFVFRFAVYLHFRRRGWIVKPGLNYGVDYGKKVFEIVTRFLLSTVVYPDAPSNVHSQFMVIIVPHWNGFQELPMTWRDAVSASRISCAVSKNVLLCGVKNFDGDFQKLTLDDLQQCPVQIRFKLAMPCRCLRWAFRIVNWEPSVTEWTRMLRCLQLDDLPRIRRQVFQEDIKATVAGGLMMRKAISVCTGLAWDEITLIRSSTGKPMLAENIQLGYQFSFNLSHHGDYVILATSSSSVCGVDVMKIEYPKYFKMMSPQFADEEYAALNQQRTDSEKLELFYRYWCLKESYLKAVGFGIRCDLSQIHFIFNSLVVPVGQFEISTKLVFEETQHDEFVFEECHLDPYHAACVCYKDDLLEAECEQHRGKCIPFQLVTMDFVLQDAVPLHHEEAIPVPGLCKAVPISPLDFSYYLFNR